MARPPPSKWTPDKYSGEKEQHYQPIQPRLLPLPPKVTTPGLAYEPLSDGIGFVQQRHERAPGYHVKETSPPPVQQPPQPVPPLYTDPPTITSRPDFTLSPFQSSPTSDKPSEDYDELMRQHIRSWEQARSSMPRKTHPPTRQRVQSDYQPSFPPGKGIKPIPIPSANPKEPDLNSMGTCLSRPNEPPQPNPRSMSIVTLLSDDAPPISEKSIGASPTPSGASKHPSASKKPVVSKQPESVPMPKRPVGCKLQLRQKPLAARSCGFGERDRRPIDPPPILELTVENPDSTLEEIEQFLRNPYQVVNCYLVDEAGKENVMNMSDDFRPQKRLMGTLVSSPFYGKDDKGKEGCFFCFPDLSVRTNGVYRLLFNLVVVHPSYGQGTKVPIAASVLSDPFTVYSAKEFPGMQKSTRLIKCLKRQGCLISLKKGNEKSRAAASSSDEDESGSEEEGRPANSGRRKRQKRT